MEGGDIKGGANSRLYFSQSQKEGALPSWGIKKKKKKKKKKE